MLSVSLGKLASGLELVGVLAIALDKGTFIQEWIASNMDLFIMASEMRWERVLNKCSWSKVWLLASSQHCPNKSPSLSAITYRRSRYKGIMVILRHHWGYNHQMRNHINDDRENDNTMTNATERKYSSCASKFHHSVHTIPAQYFIPYTLPLVG